MKNLFSSLVVYVKRLFGITPLATFEALSERGRAKAFLAWVKQQDPEAEYNYFNLHTCPLAQFGYHLTGSVVQAGAYGFRPTLGASTVNVLLNPAAALLCSDGGNHQLTFGALAQRLADHLAKS